MRISALYLSVRQHEEDKKSSTEFGRAARAADDNGDDCQCLPTATQNSCCGTDKRAQRGNRLGTRQRQLGRRLCNPQAADDSPTLWGHQNQQLRDVARSGSDEGCVCKLTACCSRVKQLTVSTAKSAPKKGSHATQNRPPMTTDLVRALAAAAAEASSERAAPGRSSSTVDDDGDDEGGGVALEQQQAGLAAQQMARRQQQQQQQASQPPGADAAGAEAGAAPQQAPQLQSAPAAAGRTDDDPKPLAIGASLSSTALAAHPQTSTSTAEIGSTIARPGPVRINVKGAFIVDEEPGSASSPTATEASNGPAAPGRAPRHASGNSDGATNGTPTTASGRAHSPSEHHPTYDIRLPNHHDVVSHIAVDVSGMGVQGESCT